MNIKKIRKKVRRGLSTGHRIRKSDGVKAEARFMLEKPLLLLIKKKKPAVQKNTILLMTRTEASGNVYTLFRYLIEHHYNDTYKIYYMTEHRNNFGDYKNVEYVDKFVDRERRAVSYRALYLAYTCQYVFYTHSSDVGWIRYAQDEQIFVNLWHGCSFKTNIAANHTFFDYVLVPGRIFVETKKEFFGCHPSKILPIGYPVYDVFKKHAAEDYARGLK